MVAPVIDDLTLPDLRPVIDVVSGHLAEDGQRLSILREVRIPNIRSPVGAASQPQQWTAVFEAALDESPETLGKLLNAIKATLGQRANKDLKAALAEVGICCVSRVTREIHPDLDDRAEDLANAHAIPEIKLATEAMRQTALSIRRLLMRPVIGTACIALAPTVLDPEQRRMELADLAVDVVTATDYLLSLLGAPAGASSSPVLERELGPDHGHAAQDSDALVRLNQRRYDAKGLAVKLGMRLLEGLRSDVATS